MVAQTISDRLEVFHDANGKPLENGKVFVGANGLNSETNQLAVFWDKALTIAAAQPIRTIGGRPKGPNGTPGNIHVDGAYSILVKTRSDALVYSLDVDALDDDASIADGSITNAKLADNSVGASKIINGSVGTDEVADDAVNSAKLANNSVSEGKVLASAITTNKIANDAVTASKIADDAVTTSQIADGSVTAAKLASGGNWTYSTINTTTGGSNLDFSDIPASAEEVEILFGGLSLNGTEDLLVQIGDAGGIETAGYSSGSSDPSGGAPTVSNGFIVYVSSSSAELHGKFKLSLMDSATNKWVSEHNLKTNTAASGGGSKALSGALTQLRITNTDADTFDVNNGVRVRWK